MRSKIVVLCGGWSKERNISLETASGIIECLDKEKYEIIKIDLQSPSDRSWIKFLIVQEIDLVIIALHGGIGEDGTIQGLLTSLNIPFIGSKTLGSAIGMDKYISKELLAQRGISTPKGFLLDPKNIDDSALETLSYPLVIKPNKDGSSIGVSIVKNKSELDDAIKNLIDQKEVLVEEFIDGIEVTCCVVEMKERIGALDVLEIKSSREFYDYEAKYNSHDTIIEKSELPLELQKRIKNIAVETFKALKANDYARIDMIVKDEEIYVLEINTLPGMTSHSLFPMSLKNEGVDMKTFWDMMIEKEII